MLWRWWSLTPTLTVGSCCVLLGRGCRYCRWNEIAAFRFFAVQKECFKNTTEQPVRKWWLLMYEEWVSDAFWHFSASSLLLGLTGHRNRRRKTSNYSTWSWRNFFIISRNIYKTTYWYLTVWQGNKITTAVISTFSPSFTVIIFTLCPFTLSNILFLNSVTLKEHVFLSPQSLYLFLFRLLTSILVRLCVE